jgi:hypothetical protein
MKKLPLCESLGCVAKLEKCTEVCRAAFGCPAALHDYQTTRAFVIDPDEVPIQVPIEPSIEMKRTKATDPERDKLMSDKPTYSKALNIPIAPHFATSADPVRWTSATNLMIQSRITAESCAQIVHDELFSDMSNPTNPHVEFIAIKQPSADFVQTLKPCGNCFGYGFVLGEKCKPCKGEGWR